MIYTRKVKTITTVVLMVVMILATTLPTHATASTKTPKTVTITKQYQLLQNEKYVNFTLEGYDGNFTAEVIFPDGHKINNSKSNEVRDGKSTYWTSSFIIRGAQKGTYTFNIQAPKEAYYNLRVYIPLFHDIAKHWSEKRVNDFVLKGIINGYGDGTFRPDEAVTGEALVKMAVMVLTEEIPNGSRQWKREFRWRVLNEELKTEMGFQEFNFSPNKSVSWSAPYLTAAASVGITRDWNETQLKKSFSRRDVALLVANVIQMIEDSKVESSSFTDTANQPEKYQKAIDLLSNYTILTGYPDGTFKPNRMVTRAEAVTILSKLHEYLE